MERVRNESRRVGLPLSALADRVNRRNMIAWALTIWSIFTALCGMAQNFWMLLLARIGVGVGEAAIKSLPQDVARAGSA